MQQTDTSCDIGEMTLAQDLSAALLTAVQDACSVLLNNCNRFAAGNELLTTNSVISLAKDDASMAYKDLVALAMEKVCILTYA